MPDNLQETGRFLDLHAGCAHPYCRNVRGHAEIYSAGYWLLATGYWLLATGYWLLRCSLTTRRLPT